MGGKYEINIDAYLDIFKYPHKYAVHPFKITDNIHYVGNKAVSSHLIDTGDGLILIDTTFPHTYPLLLNSIWEAGFSVYDIKYILHTHGHFDHFGGTIGLAALSKAKTFLGAEDARMFRERPDLSLNKLCPYCYLELFTPDVEIEDGRNISLGNTEIRAVSTPGHSPGVMSFIMKINGAGREYTVAMQGGAGFNTLNLKFLRQYNLDVSEVRAGFLEGIGKLEKEKADIVLGNHPSHNKTLEKRKKMLENPDGPNPFIDPLEWQRSLGAIQEGYRMMLAEEAGEQKPE